MLLLILILVVLCVFLCASTLEAATTLVVSDANALNASTSMGAISVTSRNVRVDNGRLRKMTYVIEDLDYQWR